MELIINIDTDSKMPIYEQIYEHIKNEIKLGNIKAGERLPSTRILSKNLLLSRQTVSYAYDQLVAEGYIEAKASRGFYAAKIESLINIVSDETNNFIEKEEKESYLYDCSPRGVDFYNFPFAAWRKLSKETFVDDNINMFAKGDKKGEPALRKVIMSYLHHTRGINASYENLLIGAGTEYLLMILNFLLEENVIAMENPGYKQFYKLFKNMGYEVESIDLDGFGISIKNLRKSKSRLVYVMPAHQYPSGEVLSVSRRYELLAWAKEKKGYIIEDDYNSEFRYKGKPIPSLMSIGDNSNIIYIGTFSRAIAPAIRISYMILPNNLLKKYEEKLDFISCSVPRPDQNILYNFIKEGYFERHLNKMRAIYKNKHDALINSFKPYEKYFEIRGDSAGGHLLIKSKLGLKEEHLIERAKKVSIKLYKISDYFLGNKIEYLENAVILGFTKLKLEEIQKLCRQLTDVWIEKIEEKDEIR